MGAVQAEEVAGFEERRAELVVAAHRAIKIVLERRGPAGADRTELESLAVDLHPRWLLAKVMFGKQVLDQDPGHRGGPGIGNAKPDLDVRPGIHRPVRIDDPLDRQRTHPAFGQKPTEQQNADQHIHGKRNQPRLQEEGDAENDSEQEKQPFHFEPGAFANSELQTRNSELGTRIENQKPSAMFSVECFLVPRSAFRVPSLKLRVPSSSYPSSTTSPGTGTSTSV